MPLHLLHKTQSVCFGFHEIKYLSSRAFCDLSSYRIEFKYLADVDSQLGNCAVWTIADTVCPSNYHKMNNFFLSCATRQADQQADLAFCAATRWLGPHERCNQKYAHRRKQEREFPFWQQHGSRSASGCSSTLTPSSGSWFLIPVKLGENVSPISVQPEFLSDQNTINTGEKTISK